MFKPFQKAGLVGLCMVFSIAAGCSLFDDDRQTLPTSPAMETSSSNAANFYGGGGSDKGFGVYFQTGVLVINVPQAGDYVVPYCITSPSYYDPNFKFCYTTIFRTTKASMIYIGLYGDHKLASAAVIPTTITADESIAQPMGELLAFSYPGMYENNYESFDDVLEMTTLQPIITETSTAASGETSTWEDWDPYTALEAWDPYLVLNGCDSSACSTLAEQGVAVTTLVQDGVVQSSASGDAPVYEIPKSEALPPSCPKNASGVPMC